MRLASRENIPVTPRGAGSGLAGGAVPLYGGIVLSLEKMNRILEIDKVNRVAVAEPGVITNDLCKRALEEGLMYAGYPMSTQTSFIGANVATNAGGAKVIKYGNTRPHVLGLEVVLPSGDVIHLGGKYRKNTWGYDLLQLMIGSEGTLGIITKVTVNLLSSTGTTADLLVPFPDMKTVIDAVSEIIVSGGVLPEAVEFMDRTCMENTITSKYLFWIMTKWRPISLSSFMPNQRRSLKTSMKRQVKYAWKTVPWMSLWRIPGAIRKISGR
jgi:glycolate oxidase